MIEVIYEVDEHRVTAKGHAGAAEAGKDLVCAAASILLYTLASDVTALCKGSPEYYKEPVTIMHPGDVEISVKGTDDDADETLTMVIDCVVSGFKLLAEQYPDNISYSVV